MSTELLLSVYPAAVQALAPAAEVWPAGQAVQLADPVAAAYLPAAHETHVDADSGEYLARHRRHDVTTAGRYRQMMWR